MPAGRSRRPGAPCRQTSPAHGNGQGALRALRPCPAVPAPALPSPAAAGGRVASAGWIARHAGARAQRLQIGRPCRRGLCGVVQALQAGMPVRLLPPSPSLSQAMRREPLSASSPARTPGGGRAGPDASARVKARLRARHPRVDLSAEGQGAPAQAVPDGQGKAAEAGPALPRSCEASGKLRPHVGQGRKKPVEDGLEQGHVPPVAAAGREALPARKPRACRPSRVACSPGLAVCSPSRTACAQFPKRASPRGKTVSFGPRRPASSRRAHRPSSIASAGAKEREPCRRTASRSKCVAAVQNMRMTNASGKGRPCMGSGRALVPCLQESLGRDRSAGTSFSS